MSYSKFGFSDNTYELDAELARIAESIQLDETRQKRMEAAYESINKILNDDNGYFKNANFEVYPQGSVRIGTTIRPIVGEEYDLDIVVHIYDDWKKKTSNEIYNELKRVLNNNAVYKEKIELKNRCIRIKYAGDFHMDILPGLQEQPNDTNRLMVPDRELKNWTTSNPRGYSEWFIGKTELAKRSLLEKAFSIENLNIEEFAKKKPLTRAVQLLKLYRDEYFKNDSENATSSIILTTIAGWNYKGDESIYLSLKNIIESLDERHFNGGRIRVLNPVNPQEDFSEKWDSNPILYKSFLRFSQNLKQQWTNLSLLRDENKNKIMKSLFSEEAVNKAIQSNNDFFARQEKIKSVNFNGLKKLANTETETQKPYINEK